MARFNMRRRYFAMENCGIFKTEVESNELDQFLQLFKGTAYARSTLITVGLNSAGLIEKKTKHQKNIEQTDRNAVNLRIQTSSRKII